MLPWSISAGTVKGCSWNNGFKDNIQAFSLGHNTFVSQVGLPLKFCPQNSYLKTQAQCVGDKLGLNLTPKEGGKNLLEGLVITFTSHEKLLTYVS